MSTPNPPGQPLSLARQQSLLAQHNANRALYGVAPLTWSNTIADGPGGATNYAAQLAAQGGCQNLVHSGAAGLGENLAATSGASAGQADATLWIAEEPAYQCGQPISDTDPNFGNYGHWTQLISSRSTEVGCGAAACAGGGEVLVCRYSPEGNLVGRAPVNAQQCKQGAAAGGSTPTPAQLASRQASGQQIGRQQQQPRQQQAPQQQFTTQQAPQQQSTTRQTPQTTLQQRQQANTRQPPQTARQPATNPQQPQQTTRQPTNSQPPRNLNPQQTNSQRPSLLTAPFQSPQQQPPPPSQQQSIPPTAPPQLSTVVDDGLTQAERDQILSVTNQARAQVGVPPLVWDTTLASNAAQYANTTCGNPFQHWSESGIPRPCYVYDPNADPNAPLGAPTKMIVGKQPATANCMPMGENLYLGTGCPAAQAAAQFWYDEMQCTTCGAPVSAGNTGAWCTASPNANAQQSGCAHKPCGECGQLHADGVGDDHQSRVREETRPAGDFVVCEYFPGGNVDGFLPFDCSVCDSVKANFKAVAPCNPNAAVGEEGETAASLRRLFPATRGPLAPSGTSGPGATGAGNTTSGASGTLNTTGVTTTTPGATGAAGQGAEAVQAPTNVQVSTPAVPGNVTTPDTAGANSPALGVASPNDAGPSLLVILLATLGAIILVILVIALIVYLARRGKQNAAVAYPYSPSVVPYAPPQVIG